MLVVMGATCRLLLLMLFLFGNNHAENERADFVYFSFCPYFVFYSENRLINMQATSMRKKLHNEEGLYKM